MSPGEPPGDPPDPLSFTVRLGIESRLTRLETTIPHLATKEDLARVTTAGKVIVVLLTLGIAVVAIAVRFL